MSNICRAFFNDALAQQQNQSSHNIIGREYRFINELTEFKGYKEQQGVLIEPMNDHYGLSSVFNGVNTIIIFNKIIPLKGNVKYKLLDTIMLNKLGKKRIVLMSSCTLHEKTDNEIIAMVTYKAKEHYTDILQARRANKKTGRFEKIANKGLDCVDVGYSAED
ncbi:hypothetical protein HK413_00780 [Mucilaginibacter sp. S1162]|uniref:Uncharacterized protein n=1 Tax=Mucilaginibacter humi TaxID=2732510 RepID=A0ABX1VYP0_9SPHI|nr:hypothetical protein [Mucilaginibacter humi]NNU33084.1 hypothetical protein [Mucilaginibacter humi]